MVRATPQEIVAYVLNYDSRHIQSSPGPHVRAEVLQHVNAHCTIIFNRVRAPCVADRTFLTALVAKMEADDPPTYMVVCLPIARHDKIAPKDEKGAVRAEMCRALKLTHRESRRSSTRARSTSEGPSLRPSRTTLPSPNKASCGAADLPPHAIRPERQQPSNAWLDQRSRSLLTASNSMNRVPQRVFKVGRHDRVDLEH
jgi:hypothetical protein